MIKIGYDKRKQVFRKSVGFVLKKGKRVQKFWALGPDKQKAEIIMLRAMEEWARLKVAGSNTWTSDALEVVDQLKNSLYKNNEATQPRETPEKPKPKYEPHKISKPLTYHQSIDYYCQQVIPTLNISDQWKANLSYRMISIKDCLDDFPLNSITSEHLLNIVNYYKNRPKNKLTGKIISPDTACHFIRTAKRLFDYLDTIEMWVMPKRFNDIFAVRKTDFTPTRAERLKARKGIETFNIDELAILYKNASYQLKEWMITSLNIGATQKELSDLMIGECSLNLDPPHIEKIRPKTARGQEVIGKWVLWKETYEILKKKMSTDPEWEYKKVKGVYYYKNKQWDEWEVYDAQDEDVFQINLREMQAFKDRPIFDTDSVFGTIVYLNPENVRIDHVRCAWFRVLEKSKKKVRPLSFKYLRKTGAKMISDIAGKEIGKVYLAQTADDMIGKHYVPANYEKLAEALMIMRTQLQPMFD